jgi:hypothetical protein
MYLPICFLIVVIALAFQKHTEALCLAILLYLYFIHRRIDEIHEDIYKLKDHIWRNI